MWWIIGGAAAFMLFVVWACVVVGKRADEALERWLDEQHRSGQ